ncbi:MAG: iron ABC transporter permease [Acetobacterales bacterium]
MWLADALGLESAPFDIFSVGGIIFVTALHVYPFVFLLAVNALRSLNPSLEYAALIHGASRFRVATRIVLPLVAPGILAGALLAFVDSIALFGIQAMLGLPKGVHTLPTKIYSFFSYPPRFELASALSMLLVVLAVVALYIQRIYLGRRSYVTVAGKGARIEPIRLGRWRWPVFAVCQAFFAFALFLPTIVLVGVSFMRSVAAGFSTGNVTIENYAQIAGTESLRLAVFNSLWMAATAACIAVVIGALIAYMDLRTNYRGRKVLDYLSLIPLGLPGIVLAVALVLAWIRPPLILYGTAAILIIAYVTRFIPFTVRTANASLRQVHDVLERAARISGATWFRTMRSITLPLIKSGLLVGWILVFIQAMRELSASILLYSGGNQTLAVAIYNLYDEGYFPTTCALATVTLGITLVAVVIVRVVTSRGRGVSA